jgi:D-alanyl-D-alanine carboxypeptidase/D-alanyl-D-alanine-endopeptidase (penicillin-binding protein 4)
VLRRSLVPGLLASLVGLTGCGIAASAAGAPPVTTSPRITTTTTSAAPPSTLVASLRATWSRTAPRSCLMVQDGARVLFERNPDLPVTPASTLKLLTAAAVVTRLDPASRLRTDVVAATPPAGGTVAGDLWLVGGGDPVLGTMAYRAKFRRPRLVNAVEGLADTLVTAGLRQVQGRVVGDDSRYDRQRYLPSWPARYVAADETGPLSALAVNDGFLAWSPQHVPAADPAIHAARVLTDLLRARGVRVDGAPASGRAPLGATTVASLASPTIGELVGQMLLDSDNDTAELLLKELGRSGLGTGTTTAGRAVVADTLQRLGLPTRGIRQVDGSGLDPGNRVTCRLLTSLLVRVPALQQWLPVAGQSGTLTDRFVATPVAGRLRAKTGSIRGVAALAGVADGSGGRRLTFAYLQNDVGGTRGRQLQDELGHVLVLDPGSAPGGSR